MSDLTLRGALRLVRDHKRDVEKSKPNPVVAPPKDKYQCIVIDPPWPMQKIDREVRPNQAEFGYKTMSLDAIRDFPLPKFVAPEGVQRKMRKFAHLLKMKRLIG